MEGTGTLGVDTGPLAGLEWNCVILVACPAPDGEIKPVPSLG